MSVTTGMILNLQGSYGLSFFNFFMFFRDVIDNCQFKSTRCGSGLKIIEKYDNYHS